MSFVATHQAPQAGTATWDQPDASRPPGPQLPGGLDVQVVQWWGDWAQVECSNGWRAWVDGRSLRPMAPPAPVAVHAPAPAPVASPAYYPTSTIPPVAAGRAPTTGGGLKVGSVTLSLPFAGAVLAFISAFLPWFSYGGQSVTSMKYTAKYLFTYDVKTNSGIKIGWLVMIAAAAGIVLSLVPVSRIGRRIAGGAVTAMAMLYLTQTQRALSAVPGAPGVFKVLGFGVYLALIGGVVMGAGKVPGETK